MCEYGHNLQGLFVGGDGKSLEEGFIQLWKHKEKTRQREDKAV